MPGTEFDRLVEIMTRLRQKCPWDREQTHATLRAYLLEETYETLEAIDEGDATKLREELGDLLLQIVFHCEVARGNGGFDVGDVIRGICEKLVRRHPHVFGEAEADTPEDVIRSWVRIKQGQEGQDSHLEGLPKSLPALLRAQRAQSKAHRAGLPIEERDAMLQRVTENIERLRGVAGEGEAARLLGDIVFDLVGVSRGMRVVAEDVLRERTEEFIRRFQQFEQDLRAEGTNVTEATPDQMRAAWDQSG